MNEQDYLMHYGVKGMKWGVRRYQNPDGTRTALGRQHEAELKGGSGSSLGDRARSTASKVKSALTSDKAKKAYKIAGAAVGVAAVATAAYMYGKNKGAVDAAVKNFASKSVASLKDAKYTAQAKAYLAKEGITNRAREMAGKASNIGSNLADAAKNKASSALTKAGMKARDVGYSAQANAHLAKEKLGSAAKSAIGTARNVGSNVASGAGSKARSALTKAGMKARDVGYSAQAGSYLAKEKLGSAAKSAAGTARNVASNVASSAKSQASSAATKAGMKARDIGYSAQAGSYLAKEKAKSAAKNAVGTARNVGSNIASNAKSKASSAATKAGMKARDIGYSAQANAYLTRERAGTAARNAVGTVRNVGANTVDNLKRNVRNTANRATYKRKYQGTHSK